MARVVDNLNQPVAEGGLVVTLRADLPGGVSLGGTETIEPGETKRLPAHLALPLLQSGRAVRAVEAVAETSKGAGLAAPAKVAPVGPPPAPPPERDPGAPSKRKR